MPRELVHWEVLKAATEATAIQGGAEVACIVKRNLAAALLGATAHDAPYYYRGGDSRFARVANGLHGLEGCDTFHPLKQLMSVVVETPEPHLRELGWAWVLGMFTHAIADQWFHPWVFYFSGDYYHPDPQLRRDSRRKHRLVEVYLDDWLCGVRGARCAEISPVVLMMKLRGAPLRYITTLLGSVLTERLFSPDGAPEDTSKEWRGALWESAWLQAGFRNPAVGAVLHGLAKLKTEKWAEFEALLRFGRSGWGAKLEGIHHYRNPVTGEQCQHSLNELFDGAVADCARVFAALNLEIESGVFPTALRSLRGVSLNYGIWGAAPSAARYFAERGLALPGLG